MAYKVPEIIMNGQGSFCSGCGHGIIGRLVFEVMCEMGYEEKVITVLDVACCSHFMYFTDADIICAAHGRPVITAAGVKRVRKDNPVVAYLGDGAAYSIGSAHTLWSAIRNENITVIVVNNGVFGMTGGQMAPTTLLGQKTTSSPYGKDFDKDGNPFDITQVIGNLDIAYLARGSVDSVANINKTKKYIKKAFEKQMKNEGFSLVEVISPCPTNWNLSTMDSIDRIREVVLKQFPVGEYVERGAE